MGDAKLRIAVLSRNARLYSTRRLREAALQRGHMVRVLDTLRFSIGLERETPDLRYRGKLVGSYDAVVPRVGASVTYFGSAVVRQFQQMGVFCANGALGINTSRDKLRSLQTLSRHDIGIPATEFVRDRSDVMPAIERLGGAPVVIKLLEGTQGVGVILAETSKVAEAIVETLQSAKQNVLIQKFVAESKGRDVRALVVGDRVVAAMRRVAHGTEFRSNVHRGGRPEPITLDPTHAQTAVRAVQIMGLRVAGVDMLEARDGPQVMEVNSSPGLEGIERATGIDVAGAIIDYIADAVAFPELDVRQRLTVSSEYGVSELYVAKGSEILGKRISESGLREREIYILTLERKGEVIPNPSGARVLRRGDRLVCFGKFSEMRSLVPRRRRRRVRRLGEGAPGLGGAAAGALPPSEGDGAGVLPPIDPVG